jgi:[Skp1-protein]-hydroxyproline N-acetylglucosaminyltransferase
MDTVEAKHTIFVFIPSYRDSEATHTIQCLFDTATDASRVFVGVYLQDDMDLVIADDHAANVRVLRVPWAEAKGPCFARAQAKCLYGGEEYVLMLDSHMRVVQDWDELLIKMLSLCPSAKPILTAYPAGYEIPATGTRHWSDALLDSDPSVPFLTFSQFGQGVDACHCLL